MEKPTVQLTGKELKAEIEWLEKHQFQKPTVQLTGQDGNAFAIMGTVKKALQRAGYSREQVERYLEESMSADYNNLLVVAQKWVNVR